MDRDNSPGRKNSIHPSALVSFISHHVTVKLLISLVVILCIFVVGYFAYAYVTKGRSASSELSDGHPPRILQLDVLNGCGVKGAGGQVTKVLRAKGFDVVEVKNYRTFGIPHTLVVDRMGDLNSARRVARTLGVSENNVIQQINPDYFVNVSVIVGEDYISLRGTK